MREPRAGDALKSGWSTNELPAENLSYSPLPQLQGSIMMRSRSPETEEGTWYLQIIVAALYRTILLRSWISAIWNGVAFRRTGGGRAGRFDSLDNGIVCVTISYG